MKTYRESEIFAGSWRELTTGQASYVILARELLTGGQLQEALRQAICKKGKVYRKLGPEQIYDLKGVTTFLETDCTTFHVKSFRIGFVTYHAPADLLANLRMIELMKCDYFLHRYLNLELESDLDKLIAVLYRPARLGWPVLKYSDRFRHDIRKAFYSPSVEKRAEQIIRLRPELKKCILLSYLGCYNSIVNANKSLFPKDAEGPGEPNRGLMWMNIMFDMGETSYFAGEKAAKQAFIHDALPFLNKKAKEAPKR